ncbi:MAG: hypothetical protein SF053_20805 [Bacteroidia bacterium]|nr:hypothetical protein [Bacteroidia bacterium]
MPLFYWLATWIGTPYQAYTQDITFASHIAPIIFEHCTPCHRPDGYAPFPLTTYEEVSRRAGFIAHVTEIGYMPPWKANPGFRHFANERILPPAQVEAITRWVAAGAPEGNRAATPPVPVFPAGSQLADQPDLVVSMREPFQIPGNNRQTYICYKIPYEIERDTFVRAIEFIPGNKQLVHHASYQVLAVSPGADIYEGPDYFVYGDSQYVDDAHDYAYFGLVDDQGNLPVETFHSGWLPGVSPQVFPEESGFYLPKRGVLIIRNLHYAPTPVDTTDQSRLHLYFNQGPVLRPVLFAAFAPRKTVTGDWIIPADSVVHHHINVKFKDEVSLLSINPHMHRLGTYIKAYLILPGQDTVPLVEVPRWDFDWQEFYAFDKLIHVPAGSVLRVEGTFDNTDRNYDNPNSPPQDVFFERAMDDSDEMMRLVVQYLPYWPGDEQRSGSALRR